MFKILQLRDDELRVVETRVYERRAARGGAAKIGFRCCANAEENGREVICPVSIALACHQSRLQMHVNYFYEFVCGWVIRCCAKTFTSQKNSKRSEEAVFELDVPGGSDIFR